MTTARPYQLALLAAAQKDNIIAYLDTGSGKTLISILLMQQMALPLIEVSRETILETLRVAGSFSTAEAENEADGAGERSAHVAGGLRTESDYLAHLPPQPKKIVFVVPTVSLVTQQADKIRTSTDLRVGEYSSDDSASVSHWDTLGWYQQMSTQHVLVFTPQILLNCLRHGFLHLSRNVNLLIFDECHHAWKNHPYCLIMGEFYHTLAEGEERPKVLGMTASPIYQKSVSRDGSVMQLEELKRVLDCRIVTVEDRASLDGYVSKAQEYLIEYNSPTEIIHDRCLQQTDTSHFSPAATLYAYYVHAMMKLQLADPSCKESAAKNLGVVKEVEVELGVWCAGRHARRLFYDLCAQRGKVVVKDLTALESAVEPLTFDPAPPLPTIDTLVHSDITPKLWTLIQIISSRLQNPSSSTTANTQFRGMIFVEKRVTAKIVCDLLKELSPKWFFGLSCAYVTGQGTSSHAPEKMKMKKQQEVMDLFRVGEVQLMVVTRVAEEGIDIPACKLIVIFDLFRSNTGYVQSRGRARDIHGSEYILLVHRNNSALLDTYAKAKLAELMTRSIVTTEEERVGKGDGDNDVVERWVGGGDWYSTRVAKVGGSGVDSVLVRFLKRKPVYECLVESGSLGEAWKGYFGRWDLQERVIRKAEGVDVGEEEEGVEEGLVGEGYAYSCQILDDLSEDMAVIVGAVRFTRKSAMQSAGVQAVRYLHAVGALNDHLLPVVKPKRRGMAFSFARELSELKRRKEAVVRKKGEGKGGVRFLFDAEGGEGEEDAAYVYQKKVPKCLKASEWEGVVAESTLPVSEEFVDLYCTVVSLGPQIETYTRGCDPPIAQTRNLLFSPLLSATGTDSSTNPYYCHFDGSESQPPTEPRRSFAILTTHPIPDVPDFPVFIESKPCRVSMVPWKSSRVKLRVEEVRELKAFQMRLWELCLPNHTPGATGIKETGAKVLGDESMYLVAPVLGTAVVEGRGGVEVDDSMLAPCDFEWRFDWTLVQRVGQDERVPLYDFIACVDARVRSLAGDGGVGGNGVKRQRIEERSVVSQWNREGGGVEVKLPESDASVVGGMDLMDPVYDVSDSESEGGEGGDVDGIEGVAGVAGRSMSGGEMKQKKRKREDEDQEKEEVEVGLVGEDLVAFQKAWEDVGGSGEVGSFDAVFGLVKKLAAEGRVPSNLAKVSQISAAKVDAILRQLLVQTTHNQRVYIPDGTTDLSAATHFETSKFEDVKCYGDFFEKLGYNLVHTGTQLMEVSSVPSLRSFARPYHVLEPLIETRVKHLHVDTCNVVPLPVELLRLAHILPSILYRVESFCLMDETRTELGIPELTLPTLQQAFTSLSANESFSYERLEILGDSFLKFACSADLMRRFPGMDEGGLSNERNGIVSNSNLFQVARRFDLGGLMVVSPFRAREWAPPREFWRGGRRGVVKVETRYSQKRLADFVEALVGAAFVDSGVNGAFRLLVKLGLVDEGCVGVLGGGEAKLELGIEVGVKFAPVIANEAGGFDLGKLQRRLGYTFRDSKWAIQAMTHSSYVSQTKSYETLEFLGDAVLDWIVMQYLFTTYSDLEPDKLSELRQAAVNNESFCRLAVSIGLHELVLHTLPSIPMHIASYLHHLTQPGVMESDPLEAEQEGAKMLGDLFEAVVGAVYIDAGYSVHAVWQVLKPIMSGFLAQFVNPDVVFKSPIRRVHEYFNGVVGFSPEEIWYNFQESSELDGTSLFVCKLYLLDVNVATDHGNTRQLSKRRTCAAAWKWIEDNKERTQELFSISQANVGKNWRRSVAMAGVGSGAIVSVSEQAAELAEDAILPLDAAQIAFVAEEVQEWDGQESRHDPVSSFRMCLMALEMNELTHLEQASEIGGSQEGGDGDLFLRQLMAIQEQERLELQRMQDAQLKLMFESDSRICVLRAKNGDVFAAVNVFNFGVVGDFEMYPKASWKHWIQGETPLLASERISWIPHMLRAAAHHAFPEFCRLANQSCDAMEPTLIAEKMKSDPDAPLWVPPLHVRMENSAAGGESFWFPKPDLVVAESSVWDLAKINADFVESGVDGFMEEWETLLHREVLTPAKRLFGARNASEPSTRFFLRTLPLVKQDLSWVSYTNARLSPNHIMNELIRHRIGRDQDFMEGADKGNAWGVLDWDNLMRGTNYHDGDGIHLNGFGNRVFLQLLLSRFV
ncbi:hypothetical protein HDU98_007453 [Podochytrium sp. JEL0797]|nr:hypothetical protein HDU98_007453 [Podochytrium sp. JEL0797]